MMDFGHVLFSKKIKSATCWQHLSPNYLCTHFLLKQFVSNSLFKTTPLFEGSGEIRFFLEFHLLCTRVNESRGNVGQSAAFSFCQRTTPVPKDHRLALSLPVRVHPLLNAGLFWTTVMVPVQPNFVCSWLPVLPGDILFLNIALSGLHLQAFSKHQPQPFSKFLSEQSTPAVVTVTSFFPQCTIFGAHTRGVTVASFSLNTSLMNALWFRQCLLSYIF